MEEGIWMPFDACETETFLLVEKFDPSSERQDVSGFVFEANVLGFKGSLYVMHGDSLKKRKEAERGDLDAVPVEDREGVGDST